jgi:hypothetical protein
MLKEDLSNDPGLAVVAAMEIARVTNEDSFLDQVAKRHLSSAELSEVRYDMNRNLRYSAFVRAKLLALSPAWAGFSKTGIEALGRNDLFHVP